MVRRKVIGMLFVFFFGFLLSAHADEWVKTYGGGSQDYVNSIQQTADGGIIVGGSLDGTPWIFKLDNRGSVQWQKHIDKKNIYGNPSVLSIQQTTDGGYITTTGLPIDSHGYYSYERSCIRCHDSGGTSSIVKLDYSGTIQWQKTNGYADNVSFNSIQQTSDGGYIVAGSIYAGSMMCVVVLKLDGGGTIEWQKKFGGGWANSIRQAADGGYIVAGVINPDYDYGDTYPWVFKLDGSGTIEWQKRFDGGWAKAIQQTKDGGYIVTGGPRHDTSYTHAAWVSKLDSDGTVQWRKAFEETGSLFSGKSIQQTADGGYIVAGATGAYDGDAWICKLDGTGTVQWQKTYGGGSFDAVYSIAQTSDGGYIAAGFTNFFHEAGDAWVLKVDGNGNISACSLEGAPNVAITDLDPTLSDTSAEVSDLSYSLYSTGRESYPAYAGEAGICYAGYPELTISPLSHNFGDVYTEDTSTPQTFTIANTGTADLMIDAVDLFGGDASMFDVTPGGPNPCQSLVPTVPPDSECTIVAAFSPSSAGSKSTTLSISGNDPDAATAVIPLTGNGVARGVPDLVVSSLSAPTKAGAAASVTLTDTTKNQGTGTAVASTTRFYWSTNRIWSADDILLGSRSIPALAPGAVSTGNTTITVPENASPGIFYIIAKADADNANTEIREINNTRAKPIRIGPDLYVSGLAAPVSTMRGSKVSITDTTGNRGGGAAEPSMTNLYLSRDALLDAEDVLLGGRAVGSLDGGARGAGKTTVTMPVGTTPGAYFIIAMADDGNRVVEINEANNKRYRPIIVIKDFTGIEPIHDNLRFAPDCSNMHCHGPEVTFDKIYGIHGNECAKCHDSRRPDVAAAIARGEAGTPVDCLQCHTYDSNLHHQAEDWQNYPASCLGCHQP